MPNRGGTSALSTGAMRAESGSRGTSGLASTTASGACGSLAAAASAGIAAPRGGQVAERFSAPTASLRVIVIAVTSFSLSVQTLTLKLPAYTFGLAPFHTTPSISFELRISLFATDAPAAAAACL